MLIIHDIKIINDNKCSFISDFSNQVKFSFEKRNITFLTAIGLYMSRKIGFNLKRDLGRDKLHDGIVISGINNRIVLGFISFSVLLSDLSFTNASNTLQKQDAFTTIEYFFNTPQ